MSHFIDSEINLPGVPAPVRQLVTRNVLPGERRLFRVGETAWFVESVCAGGVECVGPGHDQIVRPLVRTRVLLDLRTNGVRLFRQPIRMPEEDHLPGAFMPLELTVGVGSDGLSGAVTNSHHKPAHLFLWLPGPTK